MDKDKQSIELLLRTPQEVMLDCAARVRAMRIEQNLSQIALAERVKRPEKYSFITCFPLLLCWDGLRSLTGCLLYPKSRSRFSILKNPKSDRGRAENETFRLFEYPWHPSDGRFAL